MEEFYDINNDRVKSYEKCVGRYIAYYHKKSKVYKRWYIGLSILKIAATALIPVVEIVPLVKVDGMKSVVIVTAGAAILIVESVLALMNAKEKWISYRSTCDMLCHEQRLFSTKTGIYVESEKDVFARYVQIVEEIVVKESKQWTKIVEQSKPEEKTDTDNEQ